MAKKKSKKSSGAKSNGKKYKPHNREKRESSFLDGILKILLTMTSASIVRLINGLCGTSYPLDSLVKFESTETYSLDGGKLIADAVVTITTSDPVTGNYALHKHVFEFMSYLDPTLPMRVFGYMLREAQKDPIIGEGSVTLNIPDGIIMYLYDGMPAYNSLVMNFADNSSTEVKIRVVNFLERTFEENARDLLPILPLEVLRYYQPTRNVLTEEMKDMLREHVIRIQDTIAEAVEKEDLCISDARIMKVVLERLYEYAYLDRYEELKKEDYLMRNWLTIEYPKELADTRKREREAKDENFRLMSDMARIQQNAAQEKQLAAQARQLAAKEKQRADDAEQRADDAEQENKMLRDILKQYGWSAPAAP